MDGLASIAHIFRRGLAILLALSAPNHITRIYVLYIVDNSLDAMTEILLPVKLKNCVYKLSLKLSTVLIALYTMSLFFPTSSYIKRF